MTDVTEIFIHWYAGRSHSEIASSLGVDRKTVRKYLGPAIAAGIEPGGPVMTAAEWAKLVGQWFPEITDTRLRQTTWPEIEKHRDYIADMLKLGVTQATIHQRLRDEQGLVASVASLKRWVAANLAEEVRRDRVIVLGDEAEPGAEAQIDYGHLGSWVDPRSGKKHRVWAFVMVLACSRLLFVRPVLRMDQRAWTEAHVEAFAFFGGVPARLVPDNLKTGVDKPDLYDPKLNRSYAGLGEHYGTLIDPARAAKPKDKPLVERPMPYVRDSFWRGREFVSLEHMQQQAVVWCREVPAGGSAARWAVPHPCRCSRQSRSRRSNRCRASTSCWPPGRPAPWDRTFTSRSARVCTRCPGVTSAAESMPGRHRPWWKSSMPAS